MRGDILALPALEADHLNDELSVVNPAGIESVGEHIELCGATLWIPEDKNGRYRHWCATAVDVPIAKFGSGMGTRIDHG